MSVVVDLENIPRGEHWAILTQWTVTIPGDERSKTNPGHGYPERTEKGLIYRVFLSEAEFITELENRARNAPMYGPFRAIHVKHTYRSQTLTTVTKD